MSNEPTHELYAAPRRPGRQCEEILCGPTIKLTPRRTGLVLLAGGIKVLLRVLRFYGRYLLLVLDWQAFWSCVWALA